MPGNLPLVAIFRVYCEGLIAWWAVSRTNIAPPGRPSTPLPHSRVLVKLSATEQPGGIALLLACQDSSGQPECCPDRLAERAARLLARFALVRGVSPPDRSRCVLVATRLIDGRAAAALRSGSQARGWNGWLDGVTRWCARSSHHRHREGSDGDQAAGTEGHERDEQHGDDELHAADDSISSSAPASPAQAACNAAQSTGFISPSQASRGPAAARTTCPGGPDDAPGRRVGCATLAPLGSVCQPLKPW